MHFLDLQYFSERRMNGTLKNYIKVKYCIWPLKTNLIAVLEMPELDNQCQMLRFSCSAVFFNNCSRTHTEKTAHNECKVLINTLTKVIWFAILLLRSLEAVFALFSAVRVLWVKYHLHICHGSWGLHMGYLSNNYQGAVYFLRINDWLGGDEGQQHSQGSLTQAGH